MEAWPNNAPGQNRGAASHWHAGTKNNAKDSRSCEEAKRCSGQRPGCTAAPPETDHAFDTARNLHMPVVPPAGHGAALSIARPVVLQQAGVQAGGEPGENP